MKLNKPLVETTDGSKNSFVDPKSLSKEQTELVAAIDAGHAAEAKLLDDMYKAVEESEYTSTEMDINSEKGSYLRLATVDGVASTDGKTTGKAVVTESVNGHLTEMMTQLNEELQAKLDDAHADEAEEATS